MVFCFADRNIHQVPTCSFNLLPKLVRKGVLLARDHPCPCYIEVCPRVCPARKGIDKQPTLGRSAPEKPFVVRCVDLKDLNHKMELQ